MGQSARRWKFGWCEYVEISRTLIVRGERSALRGKPLDVLQLLLEQPGEVVPKETLLRTVWQNTGDQSLTVAVSKLRKAFGAGIDELIQNVASQGYRVAVPVLCEMLEEPQPPSLKLAPGDSIPNHANWTAVARLGGPDHNPVWLAKNVGTGEQRVYKFATDGVRLRALQREVTVAGILRHSDISSASLLRIDDWSFSASPYYIASEYIGPSLLRFAETDDFAAMSRQEKVSLIAMLADSVAAAHAMGVLHNDLKPSNVLVRSLSSAGLMAKDCPISARYAIVLVDFGDSSLLTVGQPNHVPRIEGAENIFDGTCDGTATVGSETYRAPEVRHGGAGTVEADVYALGVILYQAVAGDFQHVPTAGWEQDVLDPLLEKDISEAANRNPQKRFRSAAAMAERLHSLEQRRRDEAEREQARLRMAQVEQDRDRARAARPWIVTALTVLTVAVLISAWFGRAAVRERNTARRENVSLEAMLSFLTEDVLNQSDPASGVSGSNRAVNLTLAGAILNAVPQIDRRFPHDPRLAGKLHETIADGLRSRTQFVEADQQYSMASDEYRAAEGALSQAAIATELKRDTALMVGQLPGAISKARSNFEQQVKLIRQLPQPEPRVLVLQDYVESGLLGMGPEPGKAIPLLKRAIERAQATPDFDPMLLLSMKGRYCGLYVRLQDGPRLQSASEERIREISSRYGKDSPMLAPYEMYLQEAFFLQGRYREAIDQADRNYPRFQRLLGDHNQYTLATLANRAASLDQLGRYNEAVRDDLKLAELEGSDPSGFRMKEGSLNDAALSACRSGQYRLGLENARRVIRETGPGPGSMPAFYNGSKFVMAECLVGEQEASGKVSAETLTAAESLLKQVDVNVLALQTGDTEYASFIALTTARIALLRQDYALAAEHLAKTDSFFAQPGNDPYELQQYRRLKDRLAHAPMATKTATRGPSNPA